MVSGITYYLLQGWSTIRIGDAEDPRHWLGRFTRNHEKPESEFIPPDPSSAHGDVSEDEFRDFHTVVESSKDSSMLRKITKTLRLSKDNRPGHEACVTSLKIKDSD